MYVNSGMGADTPVLCPGPGCNPNFTPADPGSLQDQVNKLWDYVEGISTPPIDSAGDQAPMPQQSSGISSKTILYGAGALIGVVILAKALR